MTTITTSLRKFVSRLGQFALEDLDLPDEILRNVVSVVFCKHMNSGRLKEASHPAVFMKRLADGQWSNPVAVHFLEGVVTSWYALGEFDLMILICDPEAATVLEAMGQCGFSCSAQANSHIVVDGVLKSTTGGTVYEDLKCLAAEDPTAFKKTFAYHVGYKKLHPANVTSAVLQFRYSSNEKYYESRNASLHNILANEQLHLSLQHKQQVEEAHMILRQLFPARFYAQYHPLAPASSDAGQPVPQSPVQTGQLPSAAGGQSPAVQYGAPASAAPTKGWGSGPQALPARPPAPGMGGLAATESAPAFLGASATAAQADSAMEEEGDAIQTSNSFSFA